MAKKTFDSFVPQIRVSDDTRKGLEEMAAEDDRDLTDFIRLKWDRMVADYLAKKLAEEGK